MPLSKLMKISCPELIRMPLEEKDMFELLKKLCSKERINSELVEISLQKMMMVMKNKIEEETIITDPEAMIVMIKREVGTRIIVKVITIITDKIEDREMTNVKATTITITEAMETGITTIKIIDVNDYQYFNCFIILSKLFYSLWYLFIWK